MGQECEQWSKRPTKPSTCTVAFGIWSPCRRRRRRGAAPKRRALQTALPTCCCAACRVDFVYVRLKGPSAGVCHEVVRTSLPVEPPARLHDIGKALGSVFQYSPSVPSAVVPNPVGDGTVRLAVVPIGYEGDYGVLVAGSQHPDFPRPADQLLLSVAANQAAVVLHHRRSEAALREQSSLLHTEREWLRVTLASIGDAVIATDTEGRVTFLNPVAQDLTGWTAEDAQGQPLETVFRHRPRADPSAGREPGRAGAARGRRSSAWGTTRS